MRIISFQLQDGFFDWISRTPPKFHWVRWRMRSANFHYENRKDEF